MGTLELTRDTRRLRWPLSLTRAHQKTSGKQKTTSRFWTTSVKAVILIEEKRCSLDLKDLNLKDAFQQHPNQEPRPLLEQFVKVLEPSKGGGQQMALSPAITRRDDYRLGPTSSWGETSRHQSSERWREAAKN